MHGTATSTIFFGKYSTNCTMNNVQQGSPKVYLNKKAFSSPHPGKEGYRYNRPLLYVTGNKNRLKNHTGITKLDVFL